MKTYEYERNFELERDYWYFVGTRELAAMLGELAMGRSAGWGRVLDVGCGTGAWLDELERRGDEVWGSDISPEALAFCRGRGHDKLVQADAVALDFPDAHFDFISALGLIEHLENDEAFIAEMHRLLRPGQPLVLMTSSFPWLWSRHDIANEHRRRYYLNDLESKMQANGFSALRLSHYNCLLFPALAGALVGHRLLFGLDQARPERILPRVPAWVNRSLAGILEMERWLMRRMRLPWGVSMIGVFRREG